MHLAIDDRFFLNEFQGDDRSALVQHLADREIYERTLRIPYPYTEACADEWFRILDALMTLHQEPIHFVIRDRDGQLIGSVGFNELEKGHRAEIGYWLARPWWGKGLMTAAVGRMCDFAFAHWKLVRITGHVFSANEASARVLQKNGFAFEGLLRKHYLKDGRFLDCRLYARVLDS
jgi:[ribosomal protein S5]-alanine N-acetyltransferase